MKSADELGREAYVAYAVTVTTKELPKWDALPENVKKFWKKRAMLAALKLAGV